MKGIQELEKALLDQIEKLNDDSIADNPEQVQQLIARSEAMSNLATQVVSIQQLKIEAVKVMDRANGDYGKFLGIDQ